MTRKRLLLLAFLLCLLLGILVLMLARTEQKTKHQGVIVGTNQERLVDEEENVQQYGDKIYILDSVSKQLLLKEEGSEKAKVIHDFQNTVMGERFLIRQNRLYYTYDGNTYIAQLDGSQEEKFSNGEVVYMNDSVFVSIQHQETSDSIVVTHYSLASGKFVSGVSQQVARGSQIAFMKSEDERVYFTSQNQNNILSLLEVDVKNAMVHVIDQMKAWNEDQARREAYANVMKTERGYYKIVDVFYVTTEKDLYQYSYLHVDDEFYNGQVGRNLAKLPHQEEYAIYEYFDEDTNQMELSYTDGHADSWKEIFYGDVSIHFQLDGQQLLMDQVKIGELPEKAMALKKVIRIGDVYYVWLTDDKNSVWYCYCEKENQLLKIEEEK